MRQTTVATCTVFALSALLAACGAEKTTKGTPAPAEAPAPAVKAEAPKQAETKKVKVVDGAPPSEADRYELSIEPPAKATVGEKATVKVAVSPKAPWHVNLDYPTSLELAPPSGVTLPKAKLKKADAARLDENAAEFHVEVVAQDPGTKAFTGTFKFAVCQDEACSPVTETITFNVDVAPKS